MYSPKKIKNDKVDILGVQFNNVTMLDMVENIKNFLENKTNDNLFIVTANPEIVVYASEHVTYRKLINSANYIIADGTGVVKAYNRLKQPLKRRVPGIELMEECIKLAHEQNHRVYLLGSKNEIVAQAQHNLQRKYPNVTFECHHGFIDLSDETVVKRIQRFNPDYLFVGMGFPKQEEWIQKNLRNFNHTVMMGVGGSLEVFSGTKKRAPRIFRNLNIEWVYRILIDWKRIGRIKSIPNFMFKVRRLQNKMKNERV